MLTISHLSAWFPDPAAFTKTDKPELQVLHDISLCIEAGKTVALVGESGSGKSVIALSILRLLEESTAIRISGSIKFNNNELLGRPLSEIRTVRGNNIAMIFQEPMTSLNPVNTIGSQLMEPLRKHQGLSKSQARQGAIKLLQRTKIPDPEARMNVYPHQLSGGQRQRVMISMALACKPSLLIADEPTTALDVSIQVRILELIQDIQREYKMAMLLITHDLAMVKKIADTIYIMKDGKITETGTTEKIFNSPDNPYTKQLMASIPKGYPEKKPDSPVLLEAHDLTCQFKLHTGRKGFFRRDIKIIKAVDHIDLAIRRGTTCGIIGESGSGKTTLGMALLRLVKSTGTILFDNNNLQELSTRELRPVRHKIQVVFQDPYSSLSPRMTIGEIVAEGLLVHRKELNKAERNELVLEALIEVGLSPDITPRYPHEFSGGQRQRIAIARVVILRPELLILDEPTSALDMTIQAQIITLLLGLQKKHNLTYLFISHDLRVIRALSDHIIVMQHGKIVESGEASSVFNNPRELYTQMLFQAALSNG